MAPCYNHVVESVESIQRLVAVSCDTPFQLNGSQCQFLAKELEKTSVFLVQKDVSSKFDQGAPSTSLRHLCAAVQRAELLVKKCCCKDSESWLVAAMTSVEIQEDFMAIVLEIHMWRMFVGFSITSASREEKAEEMKLMDEEYHQFFKELRKDSHALRQAAVEDKSTVSSKMSRIADVHGSTSELEHYLRAVCMQSWLTGHATLQSDTELRQYKIVHKMGQGGCGVVLKVRWLGVECALKMLNVQDAKEATALKGLFHPNIVRFFHYWEDPPNKPQSHLLMELMPEDLSTHMKMKVGKAGMKPFSLPVAIDIMYQVAQAMQYMHDVKHLTHRDLKPSNILVKNRPNAGLACADGEGYLDIKLADFGLVKPYENSSTVHAHTMNTGTRLYQAPEMFGEDSVQKRHYLAMADVWSFGVTCAEILTGKAPYFEHAKDSKLVTQSRVLKEGLRPTLPKDCPKYLKFCIRSCWEQLPQRRPTFASICKLLRHAKFLSLGVTNLDYSKSFFACGTQCDQVISLSRSSSRARFSTFFQPPFSAFIKSSLKFIKSGVPALPKSEKCVPSATFLQAIPTQMIVEESPQVNKDIAAALATPHSLESTTAHDYAGLDQAVRRYSVQKSKRPVRSGTKTRPLLYGAWLEDKSALPELLPERPKSRKNASASNSPAHLPRWSSESDITFPQLRPPAVRGLLRSHIASSSSHEDLNNGSQEQNRYYSRAPHPAVSDQDEATIPSSKLIGVALLEVKHDVILFAIDLMLDMHEHPWKLDSFKQSILHEMNAEVRPVQWRYIVQAFVCKCFFEGFSDPNGYFGLEGFQTDNMSTINSFADFTKFKDKAASISMLMDADAPDSSFLGRFCFEKFMFICGEVPLPIYQDERYWVALRRHPRTVFYQNFLKVAVSVWLLHRLAHSFDQKVDLLTYEKGSPFQRETMESVIPGFSEEWNEGNDVNIEVLFSVIPGFQVNTTVAKCEVYPRDKVNLPPTPNGDGSGQSQASEYFSSHSTAEECVRI